MENTLKFKLHAREVKYENINFISCSAEIKNRWFKIKFTKDCEVSPQKRGLYDIEINPDECSIVKGGLFFRKDGTQGEENPTIWVRNVVNLRRWTEDEMKAENRAKFDEFFKSNTPNFEEIKTDDDLPF